MLRQKNILTVLSNFYRQRGILVPPKDSLVRSDLAVKFPRCYAKNSCDNGRNEGPSKSSTTVKHVERSLKTPNLNEVKAVQSSTQQCDPKFHRIECDDNSDVERAKQLNKKILAGVLLTAGTVYTLWKFGPFSREDEEKIAIKQEAKPVLTKVPASSSEIPASVPYLLVGGGTASFSAFRSIKSMDPKAKVLVVSSENQLPYMRPPLSKEMWFDTDSIGGKNLIFKQWNGSERSLLYEPEDFYIPCKDLENSVNGGVAVARGWKVERIDAFNRIAYLEDGYQIKYDKCLLATGSKPKNIDVFSKAPDEIRKHVMLFREIPDFVELHQHVNGADSIAIIGGGFLGSELACALARKAKLESSKLHVYQIFKEPGNMHKILPEYLSAWTTNKVSEEGVEVVSGTEVKDATLQKDGVSLVLSNGQTISVNKVIVAIGVEPNTDLAKVSGLEVDTDNGGFLVNAELEARSNLYAAGDCSCFYDTKFGRRRVEHHDHAVISGRLAGENMVGAGKPYLHQSMFWSDLGPDVGYEAIGIVDSSYPTVGVFAKASVKGSPESKKAGDSIQSDSKALSHTDLENTKRSGDDTGLNDYGKGVIFYLRNELVVGVLLWNLYSRMSVARQVLKDDRKYDDLNEVAKLFNIFD